MADPARELDAILADLDSALRDLRAGKGVSLSGLETRVESTCQAIAALPREQGRSLAPRLLDLVSALDAITRGLGADDSNSAQSPT